MGGQGAGPPGGRNPAGRFAWTGSFFMPVPSRDSRLIGCGPARGARLRYFGVGPDRGATAWLEPPATRRTIPSFHRRGTAAAPANMGDSSDRIWSDPDVDLAALYTSTRARTEALAAHLSPEDQQLQSMPDASPAKWHRAHTTWLFETFVLSPAGFERVDGRYDYLFQLVLRRHRAAPPARPFQRNERNAARISPAKSSGCSQAAKWPPLSSLWK
jgi:hypothetical protein